MSNGGKGLFVLGALLLFTGIAVIVLINTGTLPAAFYLGGGILIVTGTGFATGGGTIEIRNRRQRRIIATGLPAQAAIMNWWIANKSAAEMATVESIILELEVTVEGKPPYTVRHRQLVPCSVYSQFQKGAVIPVKIDPADQRRLILDI